MNNNRPGCISPTAILAALLTLLMIGGYAFFTGGGMFTAGSLNAQTGDVLQGVRSHADIGNDCARCHSAPWEKDTQGDRCMVCHTEISRQLADPSSTHALMVKNNPMACRACHSDHQGPNGIMTNMTSGTFPHDSTGYSLATHRKRSDGRAFTCVDCHGSDITSFVPAVCSDCHQKIDNAFVASHTKAYGSGCLGCHDGRGTLSKNFDHNQADFKLVGKHQGLSCEKCHLNANTPDDFKTKSVACSACHLKDDTHKGGFGKDCASCHNSTGWKPSTFDHNRSTFTLDGKHVRQKCEDCHENGVFTGTPTTCIGCHQKDDEHNGKFGQDCSACHQTSSWEHATFDHNLSGFKLLGAHADVACEKCHVNNVFKGTSQVCSGCHQDPAFHAGLFKGQVCSACHTVIKWSPAKFNLAHPEPANGGEGGAGISHGGASCRDCHTINLMTATCKKCHDGNNPGD